MPPAGALKVTRNLATNCQVEASTTKSEERCAANVVDGSPATRWTSLYEDGQWITVDLGGVYSISEVRIRWEMACAESYLIQGSMDGATFSNLSQETGHEGWVVSRLGEGTQARWVRMFGQTRATSFGFSIWDFQVVGGEVAGQPPMGIRPTGPTGPAVGAAKPAQATSWNNSSWFDVIHDRVAVRGAPSTKGRMISAAKKGEGFRGNKMVIEGQPWLRLDEAWVEECRSDITVPKGVEGLWVLIDGKSVGLGELLRPGVEPADTVNKARGGGKANAVPAKAAPTGQALAKQAAMNMVKVKVPEPKPFMPEGEWVVAHEKVVERKEPNVNADAKKIREKDDLVKGTPCYVGNNPWLKLESGGWILMDGRSAGVPGKLVVPAADIASDIMRWAEQHRNSEAGKNVVWSAQTDNELKRIEEVAEKQAEQLRPMVDFPQVVKRLEEEGFIQSDDFTLGADGIVKAVRRKLLRCRAGVLVLGEEKKEVDRLPWSEEEFPKFLAKVVPDAPFFCRTFAPEDAPTRLLILLHGSLVTGDDLVAEAETLRKLMPETAVVLPEGPVVASKELGLRVWWTPPADAPREVADIRDARKHGLLTAPVAAISRAVATVKWATARFKGVPFILGGFSQGSMLASQCLTALKAESLQPHGVLILSGLAIPFELPARISALALHGDLDDKIELDVAREVARNERMKDVKLEEIRGMGHEISDAVVDRIVKFCDQAAPVVRTVARQEESEWVQEANQAKLLRWVKKVSQVITMFDDTRFMSHIVHLNMLGLGTDCPGLGKGPLFRYLVHDAGPNSRGTVVLFHGKVYDLRRETRNLVEAYKRLRLSVAIIDYRQKFSQFCVDATVALEALGEITGSETSPVIIHATGCGGIHGLHMAIAAHAYPSSLRRRLRLLVLDGSVGNFKSLPPSPTGCIATDPIGNDEKLKYIGLPLALVGGDDACCGLKWSAGHWTVLSRAAEALAEDGKMPALTLHQGTSVAPSITEARLAPELYRACESALDEVNRSDEATSKFAEDVLSSADIQDQSEYRKFKEEDLRNICLKVAKEMEDQENIVKFWYVRAERGPRRDESLKKFIAELHMPHLEAHGEFRDGYGGFVQFEGAVASLGELNKDLKKAKEKVREAFNIQKLDEKAQKALQDKASSLGITIDQCHGIMDSAIAEWKAEDLFDQLSEKVRSKDGSASTARNVVKELAGEMNIKRGQQLGFTGSDDEVNAKLGKVFQHYSMIDPSLPVKMKQIQESVMTMTSKMHEAFKPNNKPALTGSAAKETVQDVQVTIEHALEGGSLNVLVKSNATMMDVRRAVMAELGETKLSQVKLVSRVGQDSGFKAFVDTDRLGDKRKVLMMGRPLRNEAEAEAVEPQVELLIHVDRDLGLISRVRVPRSATIAAVKAQLAQEDAAMTPGSFGLKLPGSSSAQCLDDDRRVEGLEALDFCPAAAEDEPELSAAPAPAKELHVVVHIDRALGLQTEMSLRPGSRILAVKEQLAQADPTGATKPEDFGLRMPGDDSPDGLLDDALPITGDMSELDVCMPA